MKKAFALMMSIILATGLALAARAPKTPFTYTQPDGSVITLVNHGDEFHHWTTWNGTLVEMDEKGFYRPASRMVFESRAAAAREARAQANQFRLAVSPEMRFGERHFLVLLIEFDDLAFSLPEPRKAFEKMLNEPGYGENGGTGSVRDYYMDNSAGQFKPVFDVYGPIKVSQSYTYYGQGSHGDSNAYKALDEACAIMDDSMDFSRYDHDGDGYVDNIFFYYAGYNEMEGGGANTIWPHQSNFMIVGDFDGVKVKSYACTSELTGNKGVSMTGIGLFVHEFAHVLGLPDFYDTAGDTAWNPEQFSPMSDGHKLNDYRTPGCFNSLELQMLGWMGEFPRLSDAGEYELESLSGHHLPLVIPADVAGEQFILEMRDGTGWDAYLPKGMVIYHLDASDNICYGGRTAASLWDGTASAPINAFDDHPCFYAVPSLEYGRYMSEYMIFPGIGNVTEFTPVPWSGKALPTRITDIRVAGDRVRFNLTSPVRRLISGTVKDNKGNPIEGATVTVGLPERTATQARRIFKSRIATADIRYSATTQADGSYEIVLGRDDETPAFRVGVSKTGYIEQTRELQMDVYGYCSFNLRSVGSQSRAGLMKYDPDSGDPYYSLGYGDHFDKRIMASIFYTSDEMLDYAGMEVRSMRFWTKAENYTELYALVYEDGGKRWAVKVDGSGEDGYFTVDLSGAAIKIVGDKGIYFGYALNGEDPDPVLCQFRKGVKNGLFLSDFGIDNPRWYQEPDCALLLSVTLYDPSASKYITLSSMGFTSIDNPRWKEGYSAGDTFTFRLIEGKGREIESTEWLFDGARTSSPSVTLTAGKHVVTARVRYRDGLQEELSLELEVR